MQNTALNIFIQTLVYVMGILRGKKGQRTVSTMYMLEIIVNIVLRNSCWVNLETNWSNFFSPECNQCH